MAELLHATSMAVHRGLLEADTLIEKRLKIFQEEVIKRFSGDATANTGVFRDPDFQEVLLEAQQQYARKGNPDTGRSIIDLLAARSKVSSNERVSNILNSAINAVAKLTVEEISVINTTFVLQNVKSNATDIQKLAKILDTRLSYASFHITNTESCYTYLQSLGLGGLDRNAEKDPMIILIDNYRELFYGSFTLDMWNEHVPNDHVTISALNRMIIPSKNSSGDHFEFKEKSLHIVIDQISELDISIHIKKNILSIFQNTFLGREKIKEIITLHAPCMERIFNAYETTPIKYFSLSALGQTIAHANLTGLDSNFSTPLSTWVK